jgi:hypothetical protein
MGEAGRRTKYDYYATADFKSGQEGCCDEPILNVPSLTNSTRTHIHPMLDRALNAKPGDDEAKD